MSTVNPPTQDKCGGTKDEEEIEFVGESAASDETRARLNEKKRRRNSSPMPTPKSPVKRTRKNSIGGNPNPNPPPNNGSPGPQGALPAPPPMDPATRAFLISMEQRLIENMSSINTRVQANTDGIKQMGQEMGERFEAHRKETRDEIDRAIRDIQGPIPAGAIHRTRQQEEAYDVHRRALRMWPIKGPSFAANVRTFMMNRLKIPAEFLVEMGNIDVRRHFDARTRQPRPAATEQERSAPVEEVIVTFETKEIRDKVKAAGFNLAGQNDAGMRIHVPGFLIESFNALQSLGYHLKQKEADIRRSVKFDDQNFDLVMDVRIGGNWKRISASQAREIASNNSDIKSGPETMETSEISKLLARK